MFFLSHRPKSYAGDMDRLIRVTAEYRGQGRSSKLLRSLIRIELAASRDTSDPAACKKLAGARMAAGIAMASIWAAVD